MTSRLKLPHPLALLVICLFIAAALSHILPAGQYARRHDLVTGRDVVVAGTFHAVPPAPVGFFQTLVAVPRGLEDAASVVFFVFLVGGAFAVVERTGALGRGVDWLVARLEDREALVIPVVCLAFATAGALENMQEEIIALVPVLLLLTQQLGFDALTAAAMSVGAAAVGSAFSPINPFQVGIAQKLAGLPLLSGATFRLSVMAPALALWIWGTLRHARRIRTAPAARRVAAEAPPFGWRARGVLALVLAAFIAFVYGVLRLGWDFDQMSALFFLMGVLAGLLGGLGVGGTSLAFVRGFEGMAYAGLLIGFARAIYVVLDQGLIIDTIVHGLFTPIGSLPLVLSAIGMTAVQAAIHIPVPSVSGQAVLTMPVLVPLSDLLGLSRQLTVLTYQIGAGLCELMTPTNGALMAVLAAAGVEYENWLSFVTPLYAALVGLGLAAVAIGIGIGWH
ncbi:MAG TPA: Na+/H+ antiporter NhaC family protein [Vicinamibacterales bacterium]|nr:Na+/H+ antiporter NhaC family protein [Vicinamibacterales bacterium]